MSKCTKHFEKYEKMTKKYFFAPKRGQKLSNEFPRGIMFWEYQDFAYKFLQGDLTATENAFVRECKRQ